MLFASIDIGSNAVRLLFANAFEKNNMVFVEKATLVRIPVRLGKDVYKKGKISKARIGALITTLKAFKLLIDVYKPVSYLACATAAMREAENGVQIIKKIKKEIGLTIDIIDGVEEANLIKNTSRLPVDDPGNPVMFIDVGGGSTDMSLVVNNEVKEVRSFKIGTIRLLEDKVQKSEWKELKKWIKHVAKTHSAINLVGSGGNINKITKLFGEPFKMNLSFEQLLSAQNILKGMSVEERMEHFGLRLDRADVILPAADIFAFIMQEMKSSKIFVPKIGLADGLIYKMYVNFRQMQKVQV